MSWRPEKLGNIKKMKKFLKILLKYEFLQRFSREQALILMSKLEHRVLRNKIYQKNLYHPGIISVFTMASLKSYIVLSMLYFLWRDFNSSPLIPGFSSAI